MEARLYTEKEAYDMFNVSRSTFRSRLMAPKRIVPVHIGRSIRFTREAIEKLMAELQAEAQADGG
jgi:predicted DNA-binding transcriptional regulator AlpA